MKNRWVPIVVSLLASLVTQEGNADFRPQPLTVGMSQDEVLALWGAPLEREERETKREATWLYPGQASVAFAAGRVARWEGGSQYRSFIPLSAAMTTALDAKGKTEVAAPSPPISEGEIQDILNEIVERSAADGTSPGGVGR